MMIYVLAVLPAIKLSALLVIVYPYRQLQKQGASVETSQSTIEIMMELEADLNRFGKATMELRRLDPSGILYREPIR